jgi:hypothetical protein
MTRRYSVAAARNQLARIIARAEDGGRVELTRRGKPVMNSMNWFAYPGGFTHGTHNG